MGGKRIAGALFTFAGLALANEFVVRAFDYAWNLAASVGPLSGATIRNLIGVALATAGLYLLLRPTGEKKAKLEKLVDRMESLSITLSLIASGTTGGSPQTYGDLTSAYHSLSQLGIRVPSLEGITPAQLYHQAWGFIPPITAFLRDGHIKQAREQALGLIFATGGNPEMGPRSAFQRFVFKIGAYLQGLAA